MALKEQDIIIVGKDTDGSTIIQMPITRVENVEGAVKTINGLAPDSTGNVVINSVSSSVNATNASTISNLDDTSSTQIVNAAYLATNNYVVRTYGDQTISGTKTFNNVINGTAITSQWADLAEIYQADAEYQPGTLVAFGGEKEITIATAVVNAVVSTKPALLMNNEQKGTPIALVGRVPVRVIGKVAKFDKLVLDKTNPGIAKVDNEAL